MRQSKPNPFSKVFNPLEDTEQESLIVHSFYVLREAGLDPRLLFAIPNGGTRHAAEAVKLKRTGVRAGIPDLMLAVARGGFHGLFIEMKRRQGGKVSEAQKELIALLTEQGYKCVVCKGFDAALEEIRTYLAGA